MVNNNFFEIAHIGPSPNSMDDAHCHVYYEIHFLIGGKRTFYLNDKSYDVEKGDIILAPPYTNHKFETVKTYEQYIIRLNPSIFSEFLTDNLTLLTKSEILHMPESCFDELSDLCKRMYDNFIGFASDRFEKIYVDFFYFIYLMYNYGKNGLPTFKLENKTASPSDSILSLRITNYINEHFTEDFSMETLQKQFFVSKVWLSKIFKQTTGATIFQYKLSLQIGLAKILLAKHESDNKVYAMCGFKTKEYFYRVFKKEVGLSPKQYKYLSMNIKK